MSTGVNIYLGAGDFTIINTHVGEKQLMLAVQERVKPLVHIFGHIHEGYGVTEKDGIKFINASSITEKYDPSNKPIVFDLPRKKEDSASGL